MAAVMWPSAGRLRSSTAPLAAAGRRALSVRTTVALDFSDESPEEGVPADRAPLLVVHGLLGSKQNWRSMSRALAQRLQRRVIALDMRNHGTSPHTAEHSYEHMADDVHRFIFDHQLPRPVLMGHSMGGKLAMYYALTGGTDAVESLIVVDSAPVPYRTGRLFTSYIEQMMKVERAGVTSTRQADEIMAQVAPDKAVRQFLLTNISASHRDGHPIKFRVNLRALHTHLHNIFGFPELPAGTTYDGPTCFIVGARGNYVTPAYEPRISELFPAVTYERLDAGHWVHSEKPRDFIEALKRFLGPA